MTKVQQFILLLLLSFPLLCKGQDVHYTQYAFAPSLLSPALSNSFRSEFRGGAIYRKQWASVPVNYISFLGYFDKKVLRKSILGSRVAFGGQFQFDKAGEAGLGLLKVQFNTTVSKKLSPALMASVGLGLGYATRQYNPDKLSFGSQFTDSYHEELASGEAFDNTSVGYADIIVGINARVNIRQKIRGDVGVSLAHFNFPKVGFNDPSIQLSPTINLYLFGEAYLAEKINLLFNSVYRHQLAYNELVLSSGLKFYLNKEINQDLAISFLAGLRQNDAFFPEVHLYYKNWTGGISYDINTSDFNIATAGRGGPELSIQYTANTVVPPKKSKLCPIF